MYYWKKKMCLTTRNKYYLNEEGFTLDVILDTIIYGFKVFRIIFVSLDLAQQRLPYKTGQIV